jgi:hypothetical protein
MTIRCLRATCTKTVLKIIPTDFQTCYAKSGFMRQELEFGGATARGGDLSWCASAGSSYASSFSSMSSGVSISASKLGAFLIDTLPIRNTSNSFDCIVGAHSNRHSSATQNLHPIAPGAVNSAPRGNLHIPSGAEQKSTPREMLRARTMGPQHDGRTRCGAK